MDKKWDDFHAKNDSTQSIVINDEADLYNLATDFTVDENGV